MKQKTIGIIIGLTVVLLAALAALSTPKNAKRQGEQPRVSPTNTAATNAPTQPAQTAPTAGNDKTPQPAAAPKTYSVADIAAHKDASSCWSAINGGVYDLTSWIAQHPGGEGAILSICGKDGSGAFNDQHGTRGKAANVLAGYRIGNLAQ